jgi:ketosteroid isomerase-like protein
LIAHGDRVAVEARWTGTVDVPLPTLEPGTHLKAHIAIFFELSDGRITRQRSYDCFEP